MLTDYISITELSRITQKSRPTLYKYIHDFEVGFYDGIPYSFLQLLKFSEGRTVTKKEIITFCEKNFIFKTDNNLIREIVTLLQEHATDLDLKKIKSNIEEEVLKHGREQ